jgi:hypothetical protein
MARIRSVKPEMFTSTTVAGLPMPVRWTFVGLLTYADDQGRGRDEARLVKAAVWPLDDEMPWQRVAEHLDELERAGLICRYEADGKRLLHVSGWSEHQAISHPAKPKLPECPKASHRVPPDGHRKPSGESPEERGETPLGKEQGREQGTGKGSTTVVELARPDDPTAAVFDAWKDSTGKARAQLDDKRRRRIKAALRSYPLADVLDAVRGWANSPHHRGGNEQGTVYNELTLLLRDAEHIERFRDFWRAGPPNGPPGKATLRMVRTAQQMSRWAQQVEGGQDAAAGVDPRRGQAQRELPRPAD